MTDVAAAPASIDAPERGLWTDVWYQFRHHKGAMAGVFIFGAILFIVIFGAGCSLGVSCVDAPNLSISEELRGPYQKIARTRSVIRNDAPLVARARVPAIAEKWP